MTYSMSQKNILQPLWFVGHFSKMTFPHSNSQNQLLTKGMVILRDKIRFYEGITSRLKEVECLLCKWQKSCIMLCYVTDAGQKLLDSLAETWDFFFCDVLSMLQAIFHPVQVHQHGSVRIKTS